MQRFFRKFSIDKAATFAPPCWSCESPSWTSVCSVCREASRVLPSASQVRIDGIQEVQSEFVYSDWAQTFMWRFKERSHPELLREFRGAISRPFAGIHFDAVVAAASDPGSNRSRFFDPAQELGRQMSKCWGVRFVPSVFKRLRQPFPQKSMPKSLRKVWIHRALSIQAHRVKGLRRLLLVDDLLTTGETLSAHAGLLRALDVEVWGWTLFRKL